MIYTVIPYLLLIALVGSAAVLLTSKRLAEKFVAGGIFPKAFLAFIPALQSAIRVFACVLIVAGAIAISIESGWIDAHTVSRYAFPSSLITLGAMLLILNRRDN